MRDAASRQVLAYLRPPNSRLPGKQSISRARYRIGARPLMKLLALVARPLATPASLPQAFHRGLRLLALDATQADLPDTPDNVKVLAGPRPRVASRLFRRPKSSRCWRSGPMRLSIWWSVRGGVTSWPRRCS